MRVKNLSLILVMVAILITMGILISFVLPGLSGDNARGSSTVGGFPSQNTSPIDTTIGFQNDGSPQPVQERIVIMTANLTLTVDDPAEAIQSISTIAGDLDGWVVNSTINNGTITTGSIVIRVPSAQFESVLEQIRAMALIVDNETVGGQDVTQEYVDLNSQLTNLRAAEAQLQTIMESADSTEGVLAVYNQLVSIRGQIETIEGRIQFFDESAAFSSISVSLRTEREDDNRVIGDWSPGETIEDAVDNLVSILRVLADLAIQLVIIGLPLALIFGVPLWIGNRLMRRWNARMQPVRANDNIEFPEFMDKDDKV